MSKISLIIFWGIFSLLIFIGSTIQHELAHQEIGKMHGCITPKITYNWQGGLYRCLNYSPRSVELVNQERFLHELNEIVTYNLMAVIFAILFLAMIIIIK